MDVILPLEKNKQCEVWNVACIYKQQCQFFVLHLCRSTSDSVSIPAYYWSFVALDNIVKEMQIN